MARKKPKRSAQEREGKAKPSAPPRHNPFKALEGELRALAPSKNEVPAKSAKLTPAKPAQTAAVKPIDHFAVAMAGVAPLPPKAQRVASPRRKRAPKDHAERTASQAADLATFELLLNTLGRPSWAADESDPALLDLERGYWTQDATLDLHGFNSDDARRRLRSFLGEAQQRRWRCVLIVHGQGHRSDGDPVLRGVCRASLRRQGDRVQAWCEALPAGGGKGATLVLVRQR